MGVLVLVTTTVCHAYSDYDVDGVEDSIDECPNTPFDILVNEQGCEEGSTYKGIFTVLAGTISAIDAQSDNLTNAQVFFNYRYHDWDVSLSTFSQLQNIIDEVPNTYYVTTGYHYAVSNELQAKVSLGTKQSSLQNDYYMTLNMDYGVSLNQNLFLFYSYTIAQDSAQDEYANFNTLSLGTGRTLTDYWYSSISYDFSGASLENSGDYQSLSWANTFALSTKYYFLTNYSYGLSSGASDHTISIQFGVKFE
jgi:hypothetical protein